MKMKKLIYFFCMVFMIACVPETIDEMSVESIVRPPSEAVIGSINGVVLDQTNEPIQEVRIIIGDAETTTDGEGTFRLDDIQLYEDGTKIIASKDGYTQGNRKLLARAGGIHSITIVLSEKEVTQKISSNTGGSVSLDANTIDFPVGDYLQDGVLYTGDINVFAKFLDPTKEVSSLQIPGDQSGFDQNGNHKALVSYGVLNIEIENNEGNRLGLPLSSSAELSLAIPDVLREIAPDRLAMYHFNLDQDAWLADGEAIRVGDNYIGEVMRVGKWSFARKFEVVDIGHLISVEEMTLPNASFIVTGEDIGYYYFGQSDETGFFRSRLPENQEITIELMSDCLSTPYRAELGMFSQDTENNQILLDNNGLGDIKITGSTLTCDSNSPAATSHTYVKLSLGSNRILQRLSDTGNFEVELMTCDNATADITAIDINAGTASQTSEHNLDRNLVAGELNICDIDDIQSGFSIDYTDINWNDILGDTDKHMWTIRRINGGTGMTLLDPRIEDSDGNQHMIAAFGVQDNSQNGSFLMEFPLQGFSVSGTCKVNTDQEPGFKSYRFYDIISHRVTMIDSTLFPGSEVSDIEPFEFDMTYYD